MGRKKLKMEKIASQAGRKITFVKRHNGLRKKAEELSVLCDVDVAVIAFSPTGKLYQYCNQENIEDVITRFANLTPNKKTVETWEFGQRSAQQLDRQQGLEAPRGGYARIKLEKQALKEAINKTDDDKTFSDPRARFYIGTPGIESITSVGSVNAITGELVGGRQISVEKTAQVESSNPLEIPFRTEVTGLAQDHREFFPGKARMGGQHAPTAENKYDLELQLGQGIPNSNSSMTQIGHTYQHFSNNTVELLPLQSMTFNNSGYNYNRMTQINYNYGQYANTSVDHRSVGQPQISPMSNQFNYGDTSATSQPYMQPQPLQPPGGWPRESPCGWQ